MVQKTVKVGIGRRIALLVSAAVVAAVLCVAGVLAAYQAVHDANTKRRAIEGTAFVFASAVAEHVANHDSYQIQSVLRSVDRVPDALSASVYDADWKLIASLGQRAVLKPKNASVDPGFWGMMMTSAIPVSVNIVKGGKTIGTLVLVTDVTDLRSRFINTMAVVLAASLAAASIGVVLSIPLQRRIAGPILRLTQSMQSIKQRRRYDTDLKAENSDETGLMVEAFNSLISDIRFRDDSLQRLAYFDSLTGLPNRSSFQRTLQESLDKMGSGGQPLGVLLFNIDGFHTFNDALGHSTGDAILMSAAAKLKEEATDSIQVARVGGDDFAVIVYDDGAGTQAEAMIARIQAAFYSPVLITGLELHLTLSVGATLLPRDSRTLSDALRHMDLALNAAKKLGAGRAAFFSAELDEVVRRETELGLALRSAMANGELELHYQPQFDLASKRVAGFEALARWKHPLLGEVSPSVFIPIAERKGLIGEIGDWVMEEGCRQAKEWLDAGEHPRTLAVNVSPAQILQSGFARKVRDCLSRSGLPAHLLCVELTESLFLGRSLGPVHSVLDELHSLGVTLALDDFGTGYSSLSYLSQLPFNKLKIDRSFVSNAHTSPRRSEILRSIIHMAHALGMDVVAEGAESASEIALLANLNADKIQGFGIARPENASDAIKTAARLETNAGPVPQLIAG